MTESEQTWVRLNIDLPTGTYYSVPVPPGMRASELVDKVVRDLGLKRLSSDRNPIGWWLYNRDTGRPLVGDASLKEYGFRDGHVLELRVAFRAWRAADADEPECGYGRKGVVRLSLLKPLGEVEVPLDTLIEDLVRGLAPAFLGLPATDGEGRPRRWQLEQADGRGRLPPDQYLFQLGLRNGDRFVLVRTPEAEPANATTAPPARLPLTIIELGDEQHEIEAPSDIRVSDFIDELRIALKLPRLSAEGELILWRLDNKDTDRRLNKEQTLEQNGVRAGHRLLLRRVILAGGGPGSRAGSPAEPPGRTDGAEPGPLPPGVAAGQPEPTGTPSCRGEAETTPAGPASGPGG